MTGQAGYTIRQAAYDLRKLRGKNLAVKPGTTRRYQVPPDAARIISRAAHPPRPRHRARSSPASAVPAEAVRPHTGPAWTVTTQTLRDRHANPLP